MKHAAPLCSHSFSSVRLPARTGCHVPPTAFKAWQQESCLSRAQSMSPRRPWNLQPNRFAFESVKFAAECISTDHPTLTHHPTLKPLPTVTQLPTFWHACKPGRICPRGQVALSLALKHSRRFFALGTGIAFLRVFADCAVQRPSTAALRRKQIRGVHPE